MSDILGSVEFNIKCAYCGADLLALAPATANSGDAITLEIEWDHICTMPPPVISGQLGDD